ncbi:MAG: hypothetical protein WAV41_05070 [Microgenomates group bacterium]
MPIDDFTGFREGTVIRLNGYTHPSDPLARPHNILAKVVDITGAGSLTCKIGGKEKSIGYSTLRQADVVKQGRFRIAKVDDLED